MSEKKPFSKEEMNFDDRFEKKCRFAIIIYPALINPKENISFLTPTCRKVECALNYENCGWPSCVLGNNIECKDYLETILANQYLIQTELFYNENAWDTEKGRQK
jgi:hypothetical protein